MLKFSDDFSPIEPESQVNKESRQTLYSKFIELGIDTSKKWTI